MKELPPQILGAIIGALVSMVIAAVVMMFTNSGHNKRQKAQHDHEVKQESLKHRRQKLEECYLSFSKWQSYFGSIYIGMIGYVKGQVPEERAYEIVKDSSVAGFLEQVEMIISLYYPNLMDSYKAAHSARGHIVQFFPPNSIEVGGLPRFYQAQENFEKKAEEFKEAMST
ncbi:hypothetical protein [Gilvimarinus xylanilyticus]|uniref:Uncharacterized protein n=1 Tax=Gilvimarinus xylanilyticus TaxID=2944139 RepID=A0A9X2I0F6_9GAMM|nr:hypothetical protein [Gilvimarinus xylanilyticus]MCP8899866.1 hypothetical protein [Gilvimarinus xylanilyticus]